MADEEKTTVEVAEGDSPAEPKKGNKMILFGGIGLVVIVLGVVLALFVVKPMMSDDTAKTDTELTDGEDGAHAEASDDEDDDGEEEGGDGGEEGESSGDPLAYAINELVVNPAGTGGSRYLAISLGFRFSSKKITRKFKANEPMVRDALISILSSKTVSQLTDAKQKEIMRYQIKKRLSKLLKTKKLESVYFTEFALQ